MNISTIEQKIKSEILESNPVLAAAYSTPGTTLSVNCGSTTLQDWAQREVDLLELLDDALQLASELVESHEDKERFSELVSAKDSILGVE